MQIFTDKRYRLKDGAEPVFGLAPFGTDNLIISGFDSDDMTVDVQPEGFLNNAGFWANIEDLEED